jgi:hypothetical protein
MSLALRPEDSTHPSRHALARHEAGEGSPDERAALGAHLETCPTCAETLAELGRYRVAFQAGLSQAELEARIALRAARPAPRSWWALVRWPYALGAATATALALLLVFAPRGDEPGPDSGTRTKGAEFSLSFVIESGGKPVLAEPGHRLRAGDRIQFLLTAPAGGQLHLVGVDGRGQVSVYFPAPGVTPPAFPGGAGRPVPGSIILDDAPGPERVFALLCSAALGPEELAARVRALAPDPRTWLDADALPLPGCRQTSLVLAKE